MTKFARLTIHCIFSIATSKFLQLRCVVWVLSLYTRARRIARTRHDHSDVQGPGHGQAKQAYILLNTDTILCPYLGGISLLTVPLMQGHCAISLLYNK